jgi:opacity protein-like surface antigen
MKKLIVILVLSISFAAQAQLAGHLEVNKSVANNAKGVELGAGLQYPKTLDYQDKVLIGGNFSMRYLVGAGEGITSFSLPLLAIGRYYFIGKHGCSGGAYLEVNAGARYQYNSIKILGERLTDSKIIPEVSTGLGYRSSMGYDFGFRLAWGFQDGKSLPFAGLRIGTTF